MRVQTPPPPFSSWSPRWHPVVLQAGLHNLVAWGVGTCADHWVLCFMLWSSISTQVTKCVGHWSWPPVTWLCSPSSDGTLCPPFPTPIYLTLLNSDELSGHWSCLPTKPWFNLFKLYLLGCYLVFTIFPLQARLHFSTQDMHIPPRNISKLPFHTTWGFRKLRTNRLSQAFSLPKLTTLLFLICCCQPILAWGDPVL